MVITCNLKKTVVYLNDPRSYYYLLSQKMFSCVEGANEGEQTKEADRSHSFSYVVLAAPTPPSGGVSVDSVE